MPIQTPPPSSPLSPKIKTQDSNRRVTIVDPKLFPPTPPKKLNEPPDFAREAELLPHLQSALKNSQLKHTKNRLFSSLPLPEHPSPRSNALQPQQKQPIKSGILPKLIQIFNYFFPFNLNFTKLFQTTLKGIILVALIICVYMYCWFIYYFVIRKWLAGNGTASGLKFIDEIFFQFEETKLPLVSLDFKEFTNNHRFSNNLIYNLKLNLKVPESLVNFSLGNFMVNLSGYNGERQILYKISKPLLMKFRSNLFQVIRTVVLTPLMIFGYFEEYQTLSLDLSPPSHITNINELANLVLTISNPNIQLDSANLTFVTQLTGVAYYAVNWPITTGIMITNTLFGAHLLLLFLTYHFAKGFLTSSKSPVQKLNGHTSATPSQSNLKPHLDLGTEEEDSKDILSELEELMNKVKIPMDDSASTSDGTYVDFELTSDKVARDFVEGLPMDYYRSEDDENENSNFNMESDSETQAGSQTIVGEGGYNEEELVRAWDTSKAGIRKREVEDTKN